MPLRHHTLVAWQRADDLFITIHTLTLKAHPAYERFEHGSQMRRAALDLQIRQTSAALNGYIRSVRDGANESRRHG